MFIERLRRTECAPIGQPSPKERASLGALRLQTCLRTHHVGVTWSAEN